MINTGRPRRPMDWICGSFDGTTTAGPEAADCHWLVPPSYLKENFTDPTLMSLMVWLEVSRAAPAAGTIFGFGIIVVSAFSDVDPSGIECPHPVNDCDADWAYLWFKPYVAGAGTPFDQNAGSELDRRSQAKRRLGNDKGILLVAGSIGQDVLYHVHVRALIKE